MKRKLLSVLLLATVVGVVTATWGVEVRGFRLLSITETGKMILISEIPSKTKYVLDAAPAKITVDGKPAEFKDLKSFTLIRVKFEPRKGSKDGIDIDGVATEILVSTPENPK